MRYHLHSYGNSNEKELSDKLAGALRKRNLDISTYLAKMYYCTTCGFEITLMILARMYNVDIVVIQPDFVWLSRPVAPITCGIVLVQDSSGNFLGTKTKNPVYIGLVPKISLPDRNVIRTKLQEIRYQSTPNRPIRSQDESFRKFGGGISPIVEHSSRKSKANKAVVARQNRLAEDTSSSTSASTSLLRRNIRDFEEQNLSQTAETNEEDNNLSTTIDPNEAFVEDGQRNDIESSIDPATTPTSYTKDDSVEKSETFESSIDRVTTPTSNTHDQSADNSETFDIDGTDSSTLVKSPTKYEESMTTQICEEEKTDTAEGSVYNDNSCEDDNDDGDEEYDNDDDEEHYEDKNNDQEFVDGEAEEPIQDSTHENNSALENGEVISGVNNKPEEEERYDKAVSIENAENSDDIIRSENSEQDQDSGSKYEKEPSEVTNKKPEEIQSDVNALENEDAHNSDDIIVTTNTQPETNNPTVGQKTIDENETPKEQREGEIVHSTAMESRDTTKTQNTDDDNKSTRKRRLGMGGPAFTKRRLQVKMQDISTDSDKGPKNPQAEGNNSVLRKLMCTKCPEMFFTMEGYQRHLFKAHKIRCFEKHPPQVIEKTVKQNSQETYETNYRILKSKDSDKEDDAVKSTVETYQETEMGGEDDENKTLQQDDTVPTLPGKDYKSGEHHENTEETVVTMNGKSKKARTSKKRKGKKSHLTNSPKKNVTDSGKEEEEESESYMRLRSAIQEIYDINREKPTVKCIGCETLFFSEDGMRTHFQHAHTNLTNIASPVKKGNVRSAPLMDVSTARNVEVTEDSELTNIIEPTQTRFRGRKRTRNDSKENLTNNKRSRGSPSPRNNIGEINNTKNRRTDKSTVGKNIPEVNMRRKISENSDDTSQHQNILPDRTKGILKEMMRN